MDFEIDTTAYETHHGKKPAATKRGDWSFCVPTQYGKRAWMFIDVTYKQACAELADKASNGGKFILAP